MGILDARAPSDYANDHIVGAACQDVLDDLAAGPVHDLDLDVGMAVQEAGNRVREHGGRDGGKRGEDQDAALAVPVGGKAPHPRLVGLQDCLSDGQELAAVGGWPDRPGGAVEQPGPQGALQVADGPAEDRLAHHHLARRLGEGPGAGHPREYLQLPQADIHSR